MTAGFFAGAPDAIAAAAIEWATAKADRYDTRMLASHWISEAHRQSSSARYWNYRCREAEAELERTGSGYRFVFREERYGGTPAPLPQRPA